MSFKFNQAYVFLTYAQCDKTPQELLDFLENLHPMAQYVISREKHQDGHNHLHAYCHFVSKVHTENARHFDFENHHPNIEKPRTKADRERIIKYVKKDGDFLTNIPETLSLGKRELMFKALQEEGLTKKFVFENPAIMQFNFDNLQKWLRFIKPPVLNIKQLPKNRHIWLTGLPNSGKTTYLRAYLQLVDNPRQIPTNDDWSHVDDTCDLLYFDEFRGQITIQQLNTLCDGMARLNTKGGSTYIDYPAVFVCSNYTPAEVYKKADQMIIGSILARFTVYTAPIFPKLPSYEL